MTYQEFKNLLNQTCTIEERVRQKNAYETTTGWQDKVTDVATRKVQNNSTNFEDNEIRINEDEELFFMMPGVDIVQGDRIAINGSYYPVIKVNKLFDGNTAHHLEVTGRITDND